MIPDSEERSPEGGSGGRMGEGARRRAEADYSVPAAAARLQDAVRTVLAKARPDS